MKNKDIKDWRTYECCIKAVKYRLLNSRPVPNLTFPKKVQQGGSNISEMVHILAIVVAQTKELLYMLDISTHGPLTNGHQLDQVHAELAMANYLAQVIDITLKKYIFLHLRT